MTTLLLMLMALTGQVRQEPDAASTPDIESIELTIGRPQMFGSCWVQIKNRGSSEVSVPQRNILIYATSSSLRWPLSRQLKGPAKLGVPRRDGSGLMRFTEVDGEQLAELRLKPGEVVVYEFDLRTLLKAPVWGWRAQPQPPKSPTTNEDGGSVALWVEQDSGAIARSRPIMVDSARLFSKVKPKDKIQK